MAAIVQFSSIVKELLETFGSVFPDKRTREHFGDVTQASGGELGLARTAAGVMSLIMCGQRRHNATKGEWPSWR